MDNAPPDRPPGEPSGTFEYVPLRSENEIRLVKLPPANFHEPITCTLVHAPLGSIDHPYEALSYVWGCAEDRVLIKANGQNFSVTHNLNTALRYLRKDFERTFWIDAICINQEDEREKTCQVALMTKIYGLAEQVIVWLGPPSDNSDMIMDFFEKSGLGMDHWTERGRAFLARLLYRSPDEMKRPSKTTISRRIAKVLMHKGKNRLRRALEALLEREYWYRAWVVQEILMGRKIILVCGSQSTPWDCATNVVEAFLQERAKRIHGNNKTKGTISRVVMGSFRCVQGVIEGICNPGVSKMTRDMQYRGLQTLDHLALFRLSPHHERGPQWLLRMLMALRHFKSKDPRDKIFSLLGLINRELFQHQSSGTPPLYVDYSLDFRMVSTRLFQYFISGSPEQRSGSHRGSCNILCASQPPESNGFPSWLPDFSRDNGMQPWPIFNGQYCDFDGCRPHLSADYTIVHVPGVIVTRIERDCVSGKDDDVLATDRLCVISRMRAFIQLAVEQDQSLLTSGRFWGALVLQEETWTLPDIFSRYCAAPETPELMLRALEGDLSNTSIYVLAFYDYFQRNSFCRRFAIFRIEGELYCAMVPAASQPGDKLCLLWGCEYPVLLREIGNGQDSFEFIGPCCIPGWCVRNSPEHYGSIKTIELH